MTPHRSTAALTLLALAACGGSADPSVTPPAAAVQDFDVSEPAALMAEADVRALFLEFLARGDADAASGALAPDFAGRALTRTKAGTSGEVTLYDVRPAPGEDAFTDGPAFVRHLHALAPVVGLPERVEVELTGFDLDAADQARAAAVARLRWAGPGTAPDARVDAQLFARLGLLRDATGAWTIQRFDAVPPSGEHPHGAGYAVTSPGPRFVDRTAAVGMTYATSDEVVAILQRFVDVHRILSLGGLTVCDWNRDDRPDIIATRKGHDAVLLVNDGRSGFDPVPLPFDSEDAPSHALFLDLDGDGLEEIVGATASDYEGGFAYAPLWTRSGTANGSWREIPRAFAMPQTVGVRRLAVQVASPIDHDQDGDFDLFFAVYGDARSRGEHYNALLALDGADNHFYRNDGDLQFTEVSAEIGLEGTGYTLVAFAFDADHDGDPDLFEGNDFGPNTLWRNEGGRFVRDDALGLGGVSTYTMGATLADLEVDGRWDLHISNMSSEEGMRMLPHFPALDAPTRERYDIVVHGNVLCSERGPGEAWQERARELGINQGEWAWSCHWLDADGSGEFDLWVTNGFASHSDPSLGDWQTLYWQQVLDDGLALMEGRLSRDVNAHRPFRGSFNGYERDRYFVRTREGTDPNRVWYDAGYAVGVDADHDGRATVPIDADGDGDLDLVVQTVTGLHYFENVSTRHGDVLTLRLEGTDGLPVPLGATLTVEARGARYARHVGLIEGFQAQISPDVHVGLGFVATGEPAERVRVQWADGSTEVLEDVPVNRIVVVRQGEGVTETREIPRWTSWDANQNDGWTRELARIARTPAALGNPGKPLVVRVHMDSEPRPPLFRDADRASRARVVDAHLRTGAESERAMDASRTVLLEPELFADATRTGEETTIVYTGQGHPVRILRGDVEGDVILAHVERAETEEVPRDLLVEYARMLLEEGRFREAGQMLTEAADRPRALRAADAPLFEGLARAWTSLGRVDLATEAYGRAVELDPDYALGRINLAAALVETGEAEAALGHLREARRIEGDTARVLGSLAEVSALAGRPDEALAYARELLESTPDDVPTLVLVGNLHGQAGRFDEAVATFERALAVDPGNRGAREGLQTARRLRGR